MNIRYVPLATVMLGVGMFASVARGQCSAPTSVSATDGTVCGGVTVSWNQTGLGNPNGWKIKRATSNNLLFATDIGTSAIHSYSDVTAVAGTTYWYWVQPTGGTCGSGGPTSGSDSGFRAVTPSAPGSVSAQHGVSCSEIGVTWTAASGAVSYDVARNTVANSAGATVIGSSMTTGYTDTSATPGVTYFYYVRTVGSTCTSAYSTSVASGSRKTAPGAPSVTASDSDNCQLLVTWANVGADSYDVLRNTVNDAPSATLIGTTAAQEWEDSGATPDVTYYYWVRASNACGAGAVGGPDTGLRPTEPHWIAGYAQPAVTSQAIFTLLPAPNGDLYATGYFIGVAGMSANYIAKWNGTAWSALGSGLSGPGFAMLWLPNGDLVVGGNFDTAGGITVNNIARWDGTQWHALGAGLDDVVSELTVMPNGDLVAAGRILYQGSAIARWNGTNWSVVVGNQEMYVAQVSRMIQTAGGHLLIGCALGGPLVEWDGASFTILDGSFDGPVFALAKLLNGDIIAGGSFNQVDGVPTGRIVRWDGQQWSPIGVGLSGTVEVVQLMSETEFVVGGLFSESGLNRIARWNGAAWEPLASGIDAGSFVSSIVELPDGDLAVAGDFSSAGGNSAQCVARWSPSGGPRIDAEPESRRACISQEISFSVSASGGNGRSYRWQYRDGPLGIADWTDLVEGVNNVGPDFALNATGVHGQELGVTPDPDVWDSTPPSYRFRCVVSDACTTLTSDEATLTICAADMDCSGEVDLNDFFGFLNCFDQTQACADVDGSGDVDLNDFFLFLNAFDQSC